jgi:hypothetical protein
VLTEPIVTAASAARASVRERLGIKSSDIARSFLELEGRTAR